MVGLPAEMGYQLALTALVGYLLALRAFAGIFKQSMGARNRVGIGLSYRPATGYTAWRNWFLGIDSWVLKSLKIRALVEYL